MMGISYLLLSILTPGLLSMLIPAAVAANANATTQQLSAVLTTLEGQIPGCAFHCFSKEASSKGCAFVHDFITSEVLSCLNSNCTTHQMLEAEGLITTTCGTETRSARGRVRGIGWSLWTIAAIFLAGRVVARSAYFSGMRLGADDWAIFLSFVVLTAVTIGAELMVVFGLGTDMWTLNETDITIVIALFYIAEFAYVIESAATKVSILLLYLRIFPDRQFKKYCFALITFMVLFCIAFVVTLFTYCIPFDYTWMRWDNQRTGKCVDMNVHTYICAALNIILDLVIFFLPMRQLTKLELSLKKKVGIILTFLVGILVTICSAIRIKALIGWNLSINPTMDYAELAMWSLVELDVGVICACMPGMAALFRRMKRRNTDYARSRSSNSASQLGGGGLKGDKVGIRKTTVISVQRANAGADREGESDLELVDRSGDMNDIPKRQPRET